MWHGTVSSRRRSPRQTVFVSVLSVSLSLSRSVCLCAASLELLRLECGGLLVAWCVLVCPVGAVRARAGRRVVARVVVAGPGRRGVAGLGRQRAGQAAGGREARTTPAPGPAEAGGLGLGLRGPRRSPAAPADSPCARPLCGARLGRPRGPRASTQPAAAQDRLQRAGRAGQRGWTAGRPAWRWSALQPARQAGCRRAQPSSRSARRRERQHAVRAPARPGQTGGLGAQPRLGWRLAMCSACVRVCVCEGPAGESCRAGWAV